MLGHFGRLLNERGKMLCKGAHHWKRPGTRWIEISTYLYCIYIKYNSRHEKHIWLFVSRSAILVMAKQQSNTSILIILKLMPESCNAGIRDWFLCYSDFNDRIIQGSQQFLLKWEMAINLVSPVLSQVCVSKLKEHLLHSTAKQQLLTNLIN